MQDFEDDDKVKQVEHTEHRKKIMTMPGVEYKKKILRRKTQYKQGHMPPTKTWK